MKRTNTPSAAGRKRKRSWILPLAVLVFAVYVVVMLSQLHMELKEREKVLQETEEQIAAQQLRNEDLQNMVDNPGIYKEQLARQLGWARAGELIFQEIPGVEVTEE